MAAGLAMFQYGAHPMEPAMLAAWVTAQATRLHPRTPVRIFIRYVITGIPAATGCPEVTHMARDMRMAMLMAILVGIMARNTGAINTKETTIEFAGLAEYRHVGLVAVV